MSKRVILVVLDSVGVGYLPDADKYGDKGAATLPHIAEQVKMNIPNLAEMGIGNIVELKNVPPAKDPKACFGKSNEKSHGKDTITGHWEIGGVILEKEFPVYPNGFSEDILDKFSKLSGHGVIGNCTASGTEIIQRLGDEHVKTGNLIVYTSADSVFQIAAHEDIVPIDELYKICEIARNKVMVGEHAVGRIIARPFIGKSGEYQRTSNRHDFSLKPLGKTICDVLTENKYDVAGVGKIYDIFAGSGVTKHVHTVSNLDGCEKTLNYMKEVEEGLIFTNLVDFDMLYGHRNNVKGYAEAIEEFDRFLPELTNNMKEEDILIITADHGCDPTYKGTDHTREYIPLLVYGKNIKSGIDIGIRESYSDIAATIAKYFNINSFENSKVFEVFK